MDNYNINGNGFNNYTNYQTAPAVNTKSLISTVFTWMFAGLALTTLASTLFYFVPELLMSLYKVGEDGQVYGKTIFGHIITFAPLLLIIGMSAGFNRLSYGALVGLFMAFSTLLGISLSFIFIAYPTEVILNAFLSSTALFGIMAFVGYTTKTDLTKLGSILMIGLFGIVIASLINLFMQSPGMSYIISIIAVVIFTGLTAYDMQKIKNMAAQSDGSATFKKLAVMGALNLYMDFINLFLALLRIFGGRRN